MKQSQPKAFDERVKRCGKKLQELIAYLTSTATYSGANVSPRHYVVKNGWGITFYAGDNWFCQFHPKESKEHVWALVQGAKSSALRDAGFTPADRIDKQLWVTVKNMNAAVRLVPLILRAHDAVAAEG